MDNFRVKSPIKSFRDLEVYQTTIQLSNQLTSLEFLSGNKQEIAQVSEEIPKLIAEAYGERFDSSELAEKKLSRTLILVADVITILDLLRDKFKDEPEKKDLLDKLLIKYSYQKRKILNLKTAWARVFAGGSYGKH